MYCKGLCKQGGFDECYKFEDSHIDFGSQIILNTTDKSIMLNIRVGLKKHHGAFRYAR